MSSAVSRRLSSQVPRAEMPTTPRIYYYRNRVLNSRRSSEAARSSQNVDYSESETEPPYPAADNQPVAAARKADADAEADVDVDVDVVGEHVEEKADDEEGPLSPIGQHSTSAGESNRSTASPYAGRRATGGALHNDDDDEEEEDGNWIAAGQHSLCSSPPTKKNNTSAVANGGSPMWASSVADKENQPVVDDEQANGYVEAADEAADVGEADDVDAIDEEDQHPLAQLQLAFSVLVSFLTALDIWLLAGVRKRPGSLLLAGVAVVALLVLLSGPPTPATDVPSQIDYALRHAQAHVNRSVAEQRSELVARLQQLADEQRQQVEQQLRQQDEQIEQLRSLVGSAVPALSQQVQELQDAAQSQQYHSAHRLNLLDERLSAMDRDEYWQAKIEPLHALIASSKAQTATDVEQLRSRLDQFAGSVDGHLAREAERHAELLSTNKAVVLAWVQERLDGFEQQVARHRQQIDDRLHSSQLNHVQLQQIRDYLQAELQRLPAADTPAAAADKQPLTAAHVEEIARLASADPLGRADYALLSAGAEVLLPMTSPTYGDRAYSWGAFGALIEALSGGPVSKKSAADQALTTDLTPGSCWPMLGAHGNLTVRLARPVAPTAVTIMHVPKAIAHDPARTSAPADFAVWSLAVDPDSGVLLRQQLGAGRYDLDQSSAQTFHVQRPAQPVHFVQLEILANHGHADFTCLYRLAVHGDE